MNKKQKIRETFRNDVFKRDKYSCKVCDKKYSPKTAVEFLDVHHITDRNEIVNGGFVKENGISVCKKDCHFKVEMFHIYEGEKWEEGLHPDDLYKMIGSSKELAIEKSEKLK